MIWNIISGEYPPQTGGVSDYTRRIACSLAESGDQVHVWVPACPKRRTADAGVTVHELPGHFGLSGLRELHRALKRCPGPSRILIQYVPHAYGWKAMNVPLCFWLFWNRHKTVWVMFHEVAVPMGWDQGLKSNLLGLVTRFMALLVMRAAQRVFVTIPAWETRLAGWARPGSKIECLPVPSSIPCLNDRDGIAAVRAKLLGAECFLLGHFGTYRLENADLLLEIIPVLLSRCPGKLLLLGQNSIEFSRELTERNPSLAHRIAATGVLDAAGISRHLSACDVMIQPYPDGVSGRRTSIVACLAHGRPVVTNQGWCTEDFWAEKGAVALGAHPRDLPGMTSMLLQNHAERERLSTKAPVFYEQQFRTSRIIEALR